jgi:hypothetical protein
MNTTKLTAIDSGVFKYFGSTPRDSVLAFFDHVYDLDNPSVNLYIVDADNEMVTTILRNISDKVANPVQFVTTDFLSKNTDYTKGRCVTPHGIIYSYITKDKRDCEEVSDSNQEVLGIYYDTNLKMFGLSRKGVVHTYTDELGLSTYNIDRLPWYKVSTPVSPTYSN